MKKNLLVVGAGGSIAQEIIRYFENKCNVIGISSTKLDDKLKYAKLYEEIDIRNVSNYHKVCLDICDKFKELWGIVYASGITIPGDIRDISVDDWNNSMDINLKGYWMTFKFLYDAIIKGKSSIIQINSKTGKKGSFKNSAYTASKFGGIGLTQSMALEFAETGVRVNALCLGNVFESKTWADPKNGLFVKYAQTQNSSPSKIKKKYIDLVPMKRSCKYTDIIGLVEFLLSDKSSYMTGQAINLTGGQQMW